MRPSYRHKLLPVLLILLGWYLSACGAVTRTTLPAVTPFPNPSSTPTPTSQPTITPTATSMRPVVILLALAGADQAFVTSLQADLSSTITASGLHMLVRQVLAADELSPNVRLVLAIPPDPGLAQLVAAAPATPFLALGITNLEASPNLTVIDVVNNRPDQQGFVAGVIAAMLSPDWRAGIISLSDTPAGKAARTAFLNGVEYFCGLCRPAHPPFYEYPLSIELPSTATSVEWQEAANYMADHDARAVYIPPGAGDESMQAILAQAGIMIIGNGVPPDAARTTWALSLEADPLPIIQEQVKGLLDGSLAGGRTVSVPIHFGEINPTLFTPGKQRLAEQVLSDLQQGYIDTGVDLTTGENRP
ncbi:MAG: hypothetical protein ACM3H7_03280 [Acidobacteriaceae bacterium]